VSTGWFGRFEEKASLPKTRNFAERADLLAQRLGLAEGVQGAGLRKAISAKAFRLVSRDFAVDEKFLLFIQIQIR
jgi:hypothetical protein